MSSPDLTPGPASGPASGPTPASRYAAKPWLDLLDDAQRAPIDPADSLVHAFRRSVAEAPDRTCLAYFDGRLSYREVDELSDSVAGHLAARGLEPGDRVAVLLQNSPLFVVALLGAWKAGATVVPVNPMYKSGEVAHVLRDGEVAALICSDRAWESYLRDTAADSPVRIVLTGCELDFQTRGDARVLAFERLERASDADDLTAVARAGHRPPVWGELGAVVPCAGPNRGVAAGPAGGTTPCMRSSVRELQPTGLESSCFGVRRRSNHRHGLPVRGVPQQCGHSRDAPLREDSRSRRVRRMRSGLTVGPSAVSGASDARPVGIRDHLSLLSEISASRAAVWPVLVEKFRAGPGSYIGNRCNLVESAAFCASGLPQYESPVDPVGNPRRGAEADMVVRTSDQGAEVPFGEPSEIVVRGPVGLGYRRRSGRLYVVDRKKDMINASAGGLGVSPRRRGKVWPREVEDVLYTHPAVREAAVVGVPDGYRGETVKAYISLRPGSDADADTLAAYCKDRLAAYKYPRQVEILPDLPKTASGKILRRELRSRAHDSR